MPSELIQDMGNYDKVLYEMVDFGEVMTSEQVEDGEPLRKELESG